MGRRRCSLLSRYSSAEAAFDFPCSWSSTTGSWTSTDGEHRDEDGGDGDGRGAGYFNERQIIQHSSSRGWTDETIPTELSDKEMKRNPLAWQCSIDQVKPESRVADRRRRSLTK
jgi:hypothetical protein